VEVLSVSAEGKIMKRRSGRSAGAPFPRQREEKKEIASLYFVLHRLDRAAAKKFLSAFENLIFRRSRGILKGIS
jgi:hypothetical protein